LKRSLPITWDFQAIDDNKDLNIYVGKQEYRQPLEKYLKRKY